MPNFAQAVKQKDVNRATASDGNPKIDSFLVENTCLANTVEIETQENGDEFDLVSHAFHTTIDIINDSEPSGSFSNEIQADENKVSS